MWLAFTAARWQGVPIRIYVGQLPGRRNSTNALVTIRRNGGTAGSGERGLSTTPGTAVDGVNISNVSPRLSSHG